MAARQLKLGLRVRDLDRSHRFYLRLGFRQIPQQDQPHLRYLTFGHTWLILSDLHRHGHHNDDRERAVKAGPPGLGVVLTVPTADLDATYAFWRDEGLPVTLESEDVGWARIFYGLDPDGCEVMVEQFHQVGRG
ncbi:VOC family protein [Micromonospora sp. WMMA1998]|uniref:VOC family protein n=1 Tax=Micromonospora sp. WMMA1998 TaxID=3015167 RepID=UPI00248AE312|nr:VOC family protein [Micromonospora sp. WMMA1998]WBC16185.1 VOC family protein [Micromonospora sp. WMMA1998]